MKHIEFDSYIYGVNTGSNYMYCEMFYFCFSASGSLKGEEEIGPCLTSKPTAVPPRPGGRLHGFLLPG